MSDERPVEDVVGLNARCKRCGSEKSELRKRTLERGGLQFRWQCLHCGRATTDALAHASISNPDELPPWDAMLKETYEAWLNKKYLADRVKETAFGLKFDFDEHSRYLQTPIWRSRRSLVIERARGKCEGCGIRDAEQVHHLSYEHWKEEFLWELVAVCLPCHERYHQRDLRNRGDWGDIARDPPNNYAQW